MTVSSLAPSSLSFLSSSPPQSSAERQTDPQQSHFHREKGEERQSDCSWIWGSFEEHNKAKHTQFHFQFMPGNQSPLSLSPYYFTNPPPFSYTTAKSIEMTRQSEGHSWAQRALWWNARRFAADRTSGKTNAHPASAPACLSCSSSAGGKNRALLSIHLRAKWSWGCIFNREYIVSIRFLSVTPLVCLHILCILHTHTHCPLYVNSLRMRYTC